ncbi:hypothetical protein BBJ28_00008023 [Nothophytophthora sp. Chile5]|nr:hypothetical protein BBJ28_00008023 [Nothophytophthora sp. Chile5]
MFGEEHLISKLNPTEKHERARVAMSLELVVTAAYLSGAVCIVLFTLALGWIVVWKCVLAKMPFVQELFDLKPKKPSTHDEKSISFQDRYQAYKRVRMRLMTAGLVGMRCGADLHVVYSLQKRQSSRIS